MTNKERRQSILELNEQLYPLTEEKLMLSLRYNYLANPYRQPQLNPQEKQELEELGKKISNLNERINPIINSLKLLKVKYLVEYDAEVMEGGLLTTIPNKKIMHLSTKIDIDTYNNAPDYSNDDVWQLINEIRDYVYFQEYMQFTSLHIKRM